MRHLVRSSAWAARLFMVLAFLACHAVRPAAAASGDPAAADLERAAPAAARVLLPDERGRAVPDGQPDLRLRNTLIIGTGAGLIAAYGLSNWWESGFTGRFRATNEGWFGADTEFGGADKLGHFYSNYAGVRLLTPLFEAAGNNREASVSLATWSTLGIYLGVEFVDGFSRRWRFSAQDAIANVTGALLGAALETHPRLDAMFDFRVDYRPSQRGNFDPFGDYSGQKYLLVAKADGFEALRQNRLLRYLEVAVGYGTRGYDTGGERHRDAYIGLSLNLARLLADGAYGGRMHSTPFQRGTDRLFELVQFPVVGYQRHSID